MNTETTGMAGRFWLRWILYTGVGYALGFVLGFILGHVALGNVMVAIGIGIGVGGMQWLALRTTPARSAAWGPITVLGLAVGVGAFVALSTVWSFPVDLGWPFGALGWAIALAAAGILIGVLQRPILQRIGLDGSAWWVLASSVGWGLSALALAIPTHTGGAAEGFPVMLLLLRNAMLAPAIAGLVLGAVTASGAGPPTVTSFVGDSLEPRTSTKHPLPTTGGGRGGASSRFSPCSPSTPSLASLPVWPLRFPVLVILVSQSDNRLAWSPPTQYYVVHSTGCVRKLDWRVASKTVRRSKQKGIWRWRR